MPNFEDFPHIDQWSGVWAIEPQRGESLLSIAQKLNFEIHLRDVVPEVVAAAGRDRVSGSLAEMTEDGIAIVRIQGAMQKHASSLSMGASTVMIRRELSRLSQDERVKAVFLVIESPGGTAAGTKELADAVNSFSKPIHAHIEDIGASAAYWVASQADTITANEPALVGSIGTYAVVHDLSGKAAAEGIKVHVVRAGTRKGSGVPGTEITAEDISEIQSIVDSRNDLFLRSVSEGRSMPLERLKSIADGRVYTAFEALGINLIDRVASFDSALNSLRSKLTPTNTKGPVQMEAATIAEIKEACPGCTSEFVVDCVESGMSLDQVKTAYIQELAIRAEAAEEERDEAEEQRDAAVAAKTVAGVDALEEPAVTVSQESATENWNLEVAKYRAQFPNNPAKAVALANRKNPGLRAAMIAESNL